MTESLARLWADLSTQAMQTDVDALRAAILQGRDDGLRAARYDGAGGRSADVSSHPERQALRPTRDRTDADLALLGELVSAYVTAVAEIAVRSRSGRPCEDWDEAVQDHHLLAEMDAVGILERLPGENPGRWVRKAGDALSSIEHLARRHLRRVPDDFDRNHKDVNNATCRNHARIGATEKRVTKMLCEWCYRHLGDLELAGLGPAVDLQHDPMNWPSEEMLRSHAAQSRMGVARDRRDWLVAHGVDPITVDRRRAQRRAS